MEKFVKISSILLLSSSFVVGEALAAVNPKDTSAAIASSDRYNRSSIAKEITSESHRKKQEEGRGASKYLKKKLSKISWSQHKRISRIEIRGNKSIDSKEIKSIVRPYLKGGVTKKELHIITDRIEKYYRDEGYYLPVAHASISGSILKLRVVEGKIKNVIVVLNNEKRDKKVLSNQLFLNLIGQIEKATPIKTRDLERYLLLINKIHGYTVDYELEPLKNIKGNEIANLVMMVEETQKGLASISVDNAGTSDLGKHQFTLASQIFNPIANDSLIINAGSSDKPKRFKMITAGYLKRLNSYGTSASIFASYLEDDPYYTSGSKDSKSTVIRGRLDQYVVLNNDYSVKLEAGAEKRDMKYYSKEIKTMEYNYVMGSLGGKMKIVDMLGVENWFYPYYNWAINKVSYKKNSINERNFDKNFNFFIVDWYRNQPLPKDLSLFLKASYQYTDKDLPLEHMYSTGTAHTGRGYKTGLVSSDRGISGTAELRYTKEFEAEKIKKFLETGQIFGFYDVTHFIKHNKGDTRKRHKDAVYFDKSTLPSAGVGIRLFFAHNFYGEGTAEYPLVKNIEVNGTKNKNKPLYRFLLSKEFTW